MQLGAIEIHEQFCDKYKKLGDLWRSFGLKEITIEELIEAERRIEAETHPDVSGWHEFVRRKGREARELSAAESPSPGSQVVQIDA